jgi:hypothetical protein
MIFMNVKKSLYVIVCLLSLFGCSLNTTDLSYRDGAVRLALGKQTVSMHAKTISRKIDNFSTLIVSHTLLKLDTGSLAVFDKARTDMRYEFNYTLPETLRIVFNAQAMHLIYYADSFYLYQVILSDGSRLNVMAEQLDNESLNMLYGMDNATVETWLKALGYNASGKLHTPVRVVNGKKGAILSDWTIYKVNVMQLVVPRRDMMGI